MATKFTLELLSKIISKIRYSKYFILYYMTYKTIEALLYPPLRFIRTFKSNRSMISFGRKHCKYDMHNMKVYIIYFHASFLGIVLRLSLMAKTTAQSVCKNNLFFVCLYKPLPSACFVLLYKFIFCAMHLFSV